MGQQQRIERVRFHDRQEAGRVLAVQLAHYAGAAGTVVLGLPRGGVAVAYPVARALSAPLDVLLAREIEVPGKTKGGCSLGVVAAGGVRIVDPLCVDALGVEAEELDAATTRSSLELAELEHAYHGEHDRLDVRDKTVIVVDEGLSGGSPLRSAIRALRQQRPERIVVAVPIASMAESRKLAAEADELVWVVSTDSLPHLAFWYDDFPSVSDDDVRELLDRGREDARIALLAGWQRSSAPSFTSLAPDLG